MFAAGVPIHGCLETIGRMAEGPALAQICERVSVALQSGHPLAHALAQSGGGFSHFQLKMIQAGTRSGALPLVLNNLADHEEENRRSQMRVAGALVYPSLVLIFCLALLILGPPYLMKAQYELLQGLNIEIPRSVKLMKTLSEAFFSWPCLLLAVLAAGAFSYQIRRPEVKEKIQRLALLLPALGPVLKSQLLARLCQAMSLQVRAGIGVLQALPSSAASTGHPVLVEQARKGVLALKAGKDVATSFSRMPVLPSAFIELVRAGEEAGKLDEILSWMSRYYKREFEHSVTTALNALQPLVLLMTGIVSAVMVLTTMLPMVKAIEAL